MDSTPAHQTQPAAPDLAIASGSLARRAPGVAAALRRARWLTRGWIAFVLATTCYAALLGWQVNVLERERAQHERELDAWRRNVHALTQDVGYGGFIHQFKNYVLRGGDRRYDAVLAEFAAVESRKARLLSLAQTRVERDAIETVRNTFEMYRYKMEVVKQFRAGKSPAELDRLAVVDDTAAIESLQVLRTATTLRERASRAAIETRVFWIQFTLAVGALLLLFAVVFAKVAVRSQHFAMRLSRASVRRIDELDRHLELLPDPLLHVALDTLKVLRANAAAIELFGRNAGTLLGQTVPTFLAADSRATDTVRLRELLEASMRGLHARTLDTTMIAHGGIQISVEIKVAVVETDDVPLAVFTIRDRTEYVEAVASLESAEARGRAVLQNAHDAILLVDATGAILQINRAVEALFGYGADDLSGLSVGQLLPASEDAAQWLAERAWQRRSDESELRGVRTGRTRDGETLEALDVSASAVTLEGRPCFVLVVRDVSARVEHERRTAQLNIRLSEQLEAMQQLGRDNEALDRFGSFVAVSATREEVFAALEIFGDDMLDEDVTGELVLYDDERGRAVSWGTVPGSPPERRTCWAARRGQMHATRPQAPGLRCAHHVSDEHPERATACVPVVNQNGVIGVLHLDWDEAPGDDPGARRRADVRANRIATLARALADRVGSALFNVEMEARLETRVRGEQSGEWRAA